MDAQDREAPRTPAQAPTTAPPSGEIMPSFPTRKPPSSPTRPPAALEPIQRTDTSPKMGVSPSPWMTKKKSGVRKIPNSVKPIMPLKTAVPSDRRISAPAPEATTSGNTPRINANEVIKIGRRRNRDASSVASTMDRPCRCSSLANSTIRIAFLHASPTRTTRPICTNMLTDPC